MAQTLLGTLPVRSTGAVVVADPNPEQLVERCIARLCEQHGERAAPNAGRDAAPTSSILAGEGIGGGEPSPTKGEGDSFLPR